MTRRPVVSSGQYGYNLNRLNFRFDTDTGELVGDQPVDRAAAER